MEIQNFFLYCAENEVNISVGSEISRFHNEKKKKMEIKRNFRK